MKHQYCLALITGATSGIGQELAYFLARKGIALILTGRNLEKLEQLKAELNATVIQADLSQQKDRDKISAIIEEKSPDLIINNAGLAYIGNVMEFTTQEEMDIAQVNTLALLQFTLDGAKAMKKGGVIMNIASVAAFQPIPHLAVYAASKSFIVSLSQALNEEFKQRNISVLASCPGLISNEFIGRATKGKLKSGDMEMAISIDFAVKEIWKQIENRRPVHVFDWRYRFLLACNKFIPQKLLFSLNRKGILKAIYDERNK